ncbi:hypothetical protein GOBAR_DD01852 [Gossypium barbadense]|nr:hypothetical protein GOBAR_DD01852 [Gossypium barbadense]
MGIDMDQIYKSHQGPRGHYIQVCPTLKEHIQCLLDSFQLEIREDVKTNEINTLDRKPITIVPSPFKYGDDQRVPWRYDYEVVGSNASNILGVSGITQSGHCYKPNTTGKEPSGKEVTLENQSKIDVIEADKEMIEDQKGEVKNDEDIRGLGYKPMREDVERMCKEWRAKRLGCIAGKKGVEPPLICPPLSETFYSVGFEHQERTSVKLMINKDIVDLNMISDRVLMSRDWVLYDLFALDNL